MNESLWKLETVLTELEIISKTLNVLKEDYFDRAGSEENIERNFIIISAVIRSIELDLRNETEDIKHFVDEEYGKIEKQASNPS